MAGVRHSVRGWSREIEERCQLWLSPNTLLANAKASADDAIGDWKLIMECENR